MPNDVGCPICGKRYFPHSLKIHLPQCQRKWASVEVPCPRCDKPVLQGDLEEHLEKCRAPRKAALHRRSWNGDTANAVMINFNRAGTEAGSIQSAASTTFYATASDARLKGNITASTRGGLDLLRQIKVRDFHFLKNPDRRVQGYIAQELRGLYPAAVADGAQFLAVDYGRLSPLIVAALQQMDGELRAENRRLRARVEALESA